MGLDEEHRRYTGACYRILLRYGPGPFDRHWFALSTSNLPSQLLQKVWKHHCYWPYLFVHHGVCSNGCVAVEDSDTPASAIDTYAHPICFVDVEWEVETNSVCVIRAVLDRLNNICAEFEGFFFRQFWKLCIQFGELRNELRVHENTAAVLVWRWSWQEQCANVKHEDIHRLEGDETCREYINDKTNMEGVRVNY